MPIPEATSLAYLNAHALRTAMPPRRAVEVLEASIAACLPVTPPRSAMEFEGGRVLMMPAAGNSGIGVKLATIQPKNMERGLPFIQGVYVLFDADTFAPICCIDGIELTRIRTSAVSALATKFLARGDARRLVIFGSGVQAEAHAEAIQAVRPIDSITIVSRAHETAERLCQRLRADGIATRVGPPEAVADADIVCTCTSATTPVFDGSLLAAGAHVNAMGGYQPSMRELDTETISGATLVVETREAALTEAGDVMIPINEGAIEPSHIAGDLADLVTAKVRRSDAREITVFKSVGVAFEDLAIAVAVAGGSTAAAL